MNNKGRYNNMAQHLAIFSCVAEIEIKGRLANDHVVLSGLNKAAQVKLFYFIGRRQKRVFIEKSGLSKVRSVHFIPDWALNVHM